MSGLEPALCMEATPLKYLCSDYASPILKHLKPAVYESIN